MMHILLLLYDIPTNIIYMQNCVEMLTCLYSITSLCLILLKFEIIQVSKHIQNKKKYIISYSIRYLVPIVQALLNLGF